MYGKKQTLVIFEGMCTGLSTYNLIIVNLQSLSILMERYLNHEARS